MTRTLGLDVSFYQDDDTTPQQIDFKKAKAQGAEFVIIRASQGLDTDPDLTYNIAEAKKAGLVCGAYHFIDYRIPPTEQMDHFAYVSGDADFHALDLEKHPYWRAQFPNRSQWLIWLYGAFERLDSYGIKSMLYTNKNYAKNLLRPIPEWLKKRPLWIAQYPYKWIDPAKFNPYHGDWDNWTFFQFTDRGDGLAYGMESKQVDMNYFNGSLDDLRRFAGKDTQPQPQPDPEPEADPVPDLSRLKYLGGPLTIGDKKYHGFIQEVE
jgi:lysozyme